MTPSEASRRATRALARSGGALLPLGLAALMGCRARPPPSSPPPDPSAAPVAPVPAPPAPAPVVEPADARLPFAAYREAFVQRLSDEGASERLDLLPMELEALSTPPIGHSVITLGDPSGHHFRTITVGFGRRPQPHRFGSTPPFVELLAESHRQGEPIRQTLSYLGRYLHAAERPISVRFRAFDAVRLGEAIFGERFFVLVPGGEVVLSESQPRQSASEGASDDASEAMKVTILRVIPMDEGDFIHMNMRGDGAVRAWWARHRGSDELLRRWDDVLEAAPVEPVTERARASSN